MLILPPVIILKLKNSGDEIILKKCAATIKKTTPEEKIGELDSKQKNSKNSLMSFSVRFIWSRFRLCWLKFELSCNFNCLSKLHHVWKLASNILKPGITKEEH